MTNGVKLTYFDIAARAEPIRLALAIGNLPFDDERLTREQFLSVKESLPFKQLPTMTIDGKVYAQSNAILRYVGKQANLYPKDALEALKVDQLVDHLEDIQKKMGPSLYEKDPVKKMELRKELATSILPSMLQQLESQLEGKVAVGSSLSIADLLIYQFVSWISMGILDGIPKEVVEPYPKMSACVASVKGHPSVVAWYARG